MLSPEEITVGTFADAEPGSLILPRSGYEALTLICEGDKEPIAVFLAGQYSFHSMPNTGANNWKGAIIPSVRIEVDETTVYDSQSEGLALWVVAREGPKLIIATRTDHSFGRSIPVTVKSGLPDAQGSAAFTKWQIVIGQGHDKQVLHSVDLRTASSS